MECNDRLGSGMCRNDGCCSSRTDTSRESSVSNVIIVSENQLLYVISIYA